MQDIFGEENALEFNQEEVEELLEILQSRLESLPGDGEVFAGTEGTCKTVGEEHFAGDLSNGGNCVVSGRKIRPEAATHIPKTDTEI